MVGLTAKRPAARRSRSNEGDAPNPVPLIPLRFEDQHDDENEDEHLVADLGVSSVERLRRELSRTLRRSVPLW